MGGFANTSAPKNDLWSVHVALPIEHRRLVVLAIEHALPRERVAVTTELMPDGTEGDASVAMQVVATSHAAAVARAEELFRQAVEDLPGVGPVEPEVLGVLTPLFGEEPHARLRAEAEQLWSDHRYEAAVTRAQTGLELYAKTALLGAFERLHSPSSAARAMRNCAPSLGDRRTQDVIELVIGWRVTDEPWWEAYRAHLTRRNQVVHDGLVLSADDASHSLDAVDACKRWLRNLWAGQDVAELGVQVERGDSTR